MRFIFIANFLKEIIMNKRIRILAATLMTAAAALTATASHAKPLTEAQARVIIAPLYKNFSVPQGDVTENVRAGTTTDWKSCVNDTGCRGQEESIKAFTGLAKMIPDLKLTIKEIITSGNKIIVRSEMSGTPAGEFFGVPHTGKSFKVMTIDIHTVKNGKLSYTNHLEDWAGALGQLRAK
jgi:predicted ester cyclase